MSDDLRVLQARVSVAKEALWAAGNALRVAIEDYEAAIQKRNLEPFPIDVREDPRKESWR